LYDKLDIIPFKKLEEFFKANLNDVTAKKTAVLEEGR
jgi:hypothetical protein